MKKEEKEAFSEFCSLLGLNPNDFECQDPPDFLKKDRSLAIELTAYHKDAANKSGSKMRERESLIDRIVETARKHYNKTYAIRKNVYFDPIHFNIKPINI